MLDSELRKSCVNTIRFLAADAVEKAKSGHPGAPMGMADMAFVLWNQFLRYDPDDPDWKNRDRFVLSAGHASMLLYSLLHLAGYKLSMDELKNFRQWNSLTPGHPEYGLTPGVECTTGPLGSGFSNAAGMALGAKMMGSRFNSSDISLIDSRIFVLCSDGDMQEGIASETASWAGHLGLGNLIALYDSNDITIAGDAGLAMSEDVGKRFEAYGWHVQHCDGHNHDEIADCLEESLSVANKPSLIVAKTVIGKGAPTKEGTAGSHGAPLGQEEIEAAKLASGWNDKPDFHVPDEVREVFAERKKELKLQHQQWEEKLAGWKQSDPEQAKLWDSHWEKKLPDDLLNQLIDSISGEEDATRNLSGKVIQKMAELIPSLVGGSADLEPSNKTLIKNAESIRPSSLDSDSAPDPSFSGRNIHFGIREHAMGGITNGLALFGSWRPFCGTFAVFSDFMRPSIRLAAISKLSSIFVFTHDSYGVGEDGPTHQPVEQLWALRLIPELEVWRPADAVETAAAWNYCLQNTTELSAKPGALFLTRQKTETLEREANFDPTVIAKGGYTVSGGDEDYPDLVLISTGSEGGAVQSAKKVIEQQDVTVRHVSIPCLERFLEQSEEYHWTVLPPSSIVVVVEAGVTGPWMQIADDVIGLDRFGASAPIKVLQHQFGFTAEQLSKELVKILQDNGILAVEEE